MLKPEYIPDGRFRVKRNPAWREGMTMEKLKAELTEKMKQVPGYVPAFLQPIENRILMLYTGIRAQVGVKIYGDNLDAIQRKAFEIEKLINGIDGATGVSPSRVQGKPYLNIEVDRMAMARYGLSAKDVLDAVEISIGGKNVSTTIEGRQRFPIQIRVERGERDDIEKLSRILIAAKPGMSASAAALQGGGGMGGGMAVPAATAPGGGGDGREHPLHPARHGREDHPRHRRQRDRLGKRPAPVATCRPTCRTATSAASSRRWSRSSRPSTGRA